MFDHLLESSQRDDSYKVSNIGFGEEITQVESIEVNFTHHIWIFVESRAFTVRPSSLNCESSAQ